MEASLEQQGGVVLRALREDDLAAVHELVRELAEYERLPDEVETTPTTYLTDLKQGWFEGLVAEDESGAIVGAMIFYQAYSTWKGRMLYLEDFVVAQRHRRRGIGELLWRGFIAEAQARGCTSVKWQVLDWNEPAKSFYEKMGATMEGGWDNGRLFLLPQH